MNDFGYRIGLLIHDVDSEYSRELIEGINSFCEQYNLTLIVFPARAKKWPYGTYDYQYRAVAEHISSSNIDGLIVATGTQGHYITQEELFSYIYSFSSLPLLSIGHIIPGFHNIVVDCTSGIHEAVEHFVTVHNRKRIALITSLGGSAEAAERTQAYRDALAYYSIPADETIVFDADFTYQTAYIRMQEYYDRHGTLDFDAIIAINDDMAYGIIDFCQKNGILIPEDLIVMGFDDSKRSTVVHPTLCSINQQMQFQGRQAADTLFRLLNGEEVPLLQKFSTKTYFRQTCGCIDKSDYVTKSIDFSGKRIFYTDSNSTDVAEWFIVKEQLVRIMGYSMDMQTSITLEDLRKRLNEDIASFDISGAAVCLFECPVETEKFGEFKLPDSAYVLTAFDKLCDYSLEPPLPSIPFNPQQHMLPPGLLSPAGKLQIVVPLFHRTLQYGYIVFRPGYFDHLMYEILGTIISGIVTSAICYTETLEKNQELATENELLTKHNKNLSIISRTDEMTQLLNRRGLLLLGQQTINIALDMQQTGMVIYGDMDGLKLINDTYGHDAGDRAIKAEADLLRAVFRSSDVIGRIGGDEFVVISVGMNDVIFEKTKQRLEDICREWNNISGEKFVLSISLGGVSFSAEEQSITALLIEADKAQYKEKCLKKTARVAAE